MGARLYGSIILLSAVMLQASAVGPQHTAAAPWEHVHRWGSLYPPGELIERATGRPLGTDAFAAHLRARYLEG